MKFDNQTPFPAALELGSTSDIEQLGLLSCRVSYAWDEDGGLSPLPAAEMWPITRAPQIFEGTLLLPDSDFRRQDIDILVFGDAVAPTGKRAREMRVGVASGRFVRQYDVVGDRQWQRLRDDEPWQASTPQPFESVELAECRAFGGKASLDGRQLPFLMNPAGQGFVVEETSIAATPLPNLERMDRRIEKWDDRPVPACLQKPQGGLLLDTSGPGSWEEIGDDGMKLTGAMMRHSFQQAPPDFVCPRGGLGGDMLLKGFDESGLIRFALPPEVAKHERGASAFVEVGALRSSFALRIASLIVLVPDRRLIVGYTAAFRYMMQPRDVRRTILRWSGDTHFTLER
ncbi:DUF2169 domain-containing protein [Diaphorobacter aerolatus]|uniref:DUF2169 domain-containing protein n=1 Tax=Diaphorobacter aerolatus TaxID=1288495 RepID=A0A7H0GLJ5_9BURK|nr:DUF2169 domain-containing protein [Diaphorobacter aerolatus]QNP49161.1 DUF2169 domain-containing protein [Diaphorobacter aerolatus]